MDNLKATGSAAPSGWERRKKRVRVYKKRITLNWFLAILAAAAVVSFLLIAFGGTFNSLEDNSYRPKDIERQYHEQQRMKESVEKNLLPARNGR
jgi:hypothetical protein